MTKAGDTVAATPQAVLASCQEASGVAPQASLARGPQGGGA